MERVRHFFQLLCWNRKPGTEQPLFSIAPSCTRYGESSARTISATAEDQFSKMPARSGAAGSLSATNGTQGGSGTSTPSRYASRTAFEGLAVEGNDDDDDESEEEEEEEQTAEDEEDKPLTRSAKKRAQKLAREEKRKTSKAAAKGSQNAGITRDSEGVLQASSEDSRPPSQIAGGSATAPTDLDSPARNTRAASAAASDAGNTLTETISAPINKVAQMVESTATPMSRQSSATAAGAKQTPKPMTVAITDKAKEVAATVTGNSANGKPEKTAEEKQAYWKKVYERTFYTFLMIGGFFGECSRAFETLRAMAECTACTSSAASWTPVHDFAGASHSDYSVPRGDCALQPAWPTTCHRREYWGQHSWRGY